MKNVTLEELLEAGCHFGHKAERWHPKAGKYIYTEKDGVHIIDLAKTRDGLIAACKFAYEIGKSGKTILFVGTKRQASKVVEEHSKGANAPYLVERWIGGFLTNWDSIKKNIERINTMTDEQATGGWKKYPKHEQYKLARQLKRLNVFYGGVLDLKNLPDALFVVDIRKEIAAVREALRRNLPVIAIVDTNTNPDDIDFPIPANDDAVGSITLLTKYLADSYQEGRNEMEKEQEVLKKEEAKASVDTKTKIENGDEAKKTEIKTEIKPEDNPKSSKEVKPKKNKSVKSK